jgi:hypothetical protein
MPGSRRRASSGRHRPRVQESTAASCALLADTGRPFRGRSLLKVVFDLSNEVKWTHARRHGQVDELLRIIERKETAAKAREERRPRRRRFFGLLPL